MNFDEYKRKFYVDPQPESRYAFRGIHGASLYYQDYPAALEFISKVFGPPAYIEGEFTHGWHLGDTWLSVFPSKGAGSSNVDIHLYLDSAEELDRLYKSLLNAGAEGAAPEDTLMFVPVRFAYLVDPFGVGWTLVFDREID